MRRNLGRWIVDQNPAVRAVREHHVNPDLSWWRRLENWMRRSSGRRRLYGRNNDRRRRERLVSSAPDYWRQHDGMCRNRRRTWRNRTGRDNDRVRWVGRRQDDWMRWNSRRNGAWRNHDWVSRINRNENRVSWNSWRN